jgi:hypothetical protein
MNEEKLIFSDDMTPEQLERWYKEWELSDAPDEEKEEWRNIWTQVVKSYKAHKELPQITSKPHGLSDGKTTARFTNVELLAGVLTRAFGAEVLRDEDENDDVGGESTHSVGFKAPEFVFEGNTKSSFARMLADVDELNVDPGYKGGVSLRFYVDTHPVEDEPIPEQYKKLLPNILPSASQSVTPEIGDKVFNPEGRRLFREAWVLLKSICADDGERHIEDFRAEDSSGVRFRVDSLYMRGKHVAEFAEIIKIADRVKICPQGNENDPDSITVEFSVKK